MRSPILTAPPREAREPVDEWDAEMAALLREERRGVQLRQLQGLRQPFTGSPATPATPAASTVQDQVAVGNALANMAQTAAQIASKQAESDRQRADAAERSAGERADAAAEVERSRHRDTLEFLERIDGARREADDARREADKARDEGERGRLADKLEHIEERYGDIIERLEARATTAEDRVQKLQAELRSRKTGLEELIEAAAAGGVEEHHLVKVVRALAPGPEQSLYGPDGQPVNPDLRFQTGMADVLVARERDKGQAVKGLVTLLERVYGDVREYFGLSDPAGGGQSGGAGLAAQMAGEDAGE